jgi:ADP-ribose pyrophosphatase YjhB (NUDIX family)
MAVNFCSQCGTRLVEKDTGDRFRPVCPACGHVVYLNAIVAAGTLVEERGQVVLVRRGAQPKAGHWALPGGYVEADESAEEAAIRETQEEVGLGVELDGLLDVYSFDNTPLGKGVLLLYAAHVTGGELQAGDDAVEAAFFAPEDLPDDIAFSTHRQALRDWCRARAIVYREATRAEAEVVAEINSQYDFETGRDWVGYVDNHDSALFVALDGERIVGFSSVTVQHWNRTANLNQIFVLPSYRRWGIATRLIEIDIRFAGERDVRALLAEAPATNPGLVVYLKAGFRVCGFLDTYYPVGKRTPATALFLAYEFPHPPGSGEHTATA